MNIAIDLDNVVADLNPYLTKYHNTYYYTKLKDNDFKSYQLEKAWKCTKEHVITRVYDFYYSPDFVKIKVVAGAKQWILYLSQKYNLYIVSGNPKVIEDRSRKWIKKHFPGIFRKIIHTNDFNKDNGISHKKSSICKQYEIEAIIEDHFDYALDCHNNIIRVFLFTKPWNINEILPSKMIRLNKWSEISKYL